MDVSITKLVHACLLVEMDGKRILMDPGMFTWNDERFDLSMVEGIDRILITHEHADHVSVDFVQAVLERSNNAEIETTEALGHILSEHNVDSATSGTPQFAAPHERIPMGPGPQNTGFHVEGVLSHWGSLTAATDRVRLVGPKYVIPVHDWFLTNEGREVMYRLATWGLADDDIELIQIEDFDTVMLTVTV